LVRERGREVDRGEIESVASYVEDLGDVDHAVGLKCRGKRGENGVETTLKTALMRR